MCVTTDCKAGKQRLEYDLKGKRAYRDTERLAAGNTYYQKGPENATDHLSKHVCATCAAEHASANMNRKLGFASLNARRGASAQQDKYTLNQADVAGDHGADGY